MMVSLDNVVTLLRLSVFSPLLQLAALTFILQGSGSVQLWTLPCPARCLLALFVVTSIVHAVSWASRKHRNGWTASKRLSAEDWAREVVVVTGGSGGVGAELIRIICKKGARVANVDLVRGHDKEGSSFYACDVASPDQVRATAGRIREELGPVSMVVNNAGVLNAKLLTELTDNDIQRIIGVNLTSHLLTIREFLPSMIQNQRGHVVTVSSVMGHLGIAQVADYVATKHALVGLHESLRYELDKKHKAPRVRTTLVCPGHIRTALFAGVRIPALASFIAPLLHPKQVAEAIVDALERQESTDIYMPWYAQWTPLLRMFPSFLRDVAQEISGADEAIEGMNQRRQAAIVDK